MEVPESFSRGFRTQLSFYSVAFFHSGHNLGNPPIRKYEISSVPLTLGDNCFLSACG